MQARVGLIPAHAGKTSQAAQFATTLVAHPRSRGENARQDKGRGPHRGSSPLTRGKLKVTLRANVADWLIPAHAGKTRHGDGLAGR